ncbi:hypothetical protein TNIN_139801, partial [Trichonephila inaurata madagascariensis]
MTNGESGWLGKKAEVYGKTAKTSVFPSQIPPIIR